MPLSFYHLLHLIGLIFVFIGFGALLTPDSRRAMKWHGIGLLISLISGFGMLAKLGIFKSMPTWVWVKIGLWLVLGFLPVLSRRGILPAWIVVLLAAAIGGCLAWLGYMKPVF